jgi:N-acetylglucosaminyldiphosphoundecaprenol N-acetyl-beta-D-mannosaminyltransferase
MFKLGIKATKKQEVLKFISSCKKRFIIVTPNAEISLLALKDSGYQQILNAADLWLSEMGPVLADHFLKSKHNILNWLYSFYVLPWQPKKLNFIRGREMFEEIIAEAEKKNWRVYLFGGFNKTAEKAANKLLVKYPKLQKAYSERVIKFNEHGEAENIADEKMEINKINKFNPKILFVGLGAPKQEYWVDKNLSNLTIGGAMCVGRTFEYYAYDSLAPKFIADLGLEWFWRLITGSTNLIRIWRAVVVYPVKVFQNAS